MSDYTKLNKLIEMVEAGNEGDWNSGWQWATILKLRECLPDMKFLVNIPIPQSPVTQEPVAHGKCVLHGDFDAAHFPMCPACEAAAETRQADLEKAYRKAASMCWGSIPFVCASEQFFYDRIVECLAQFTNPIVAFPLSAIAVERAALGAEAVQKWRTPIDKYRSHTAECVCSIFAGSPICDCGALGEPSKGDFCPICGQSLNLHHARIPCEN